MKNDKQTVEQMLKAEGTTVKAFTLYVVGEGIERRSTILRPKSPRRSPLPSNPLDRSRSFAAVVQSHPSSELPMKTKSLPISGSF